MYYIPNLELGGAERLLVDLIRNIKDDFDIILVLISLRGELLKEVPGNIIVEKASNPLSLFILIKKYKPDVFHSHLWKSDLIGLPTVFFAGVPRRFTTRHNVHYFSGVKRILIPFDTLCLRLSTNVVAISKAVKNFYENSVWYKGLRFEVVHNGIDLERFQNLKREERKNNHPCYFLTIASLTEKKGHIRFLEVLKELKNIDFEWHLVGEGPNRKKIEDKAKEYGLENRVVFHGARRDVENFYQKADLFILPSLWEGLGLVLIEAMAAGVPVFASDVDGVREIVEDGENRVLFRYDKSNQAIIRALCQFIENKDKQKEFLNNSENRILKFSIRQMSKKYTRMYGSSKPDNFENRIKEWIRLFLVLPWINAVLVRPLYYFHFMIPHKILYRLPVSGKIEIRAKEIKKPVYIISNGGDRIASKMYWGGINAYEPEVIHLMMRLSQKAVVVFDIGANTGVMSLIISACLPPEGTLYSFEPVPNIYENLIKNIEFNKIKNCIPFQVAMGNTSKKQRIYIPNVTSIPTSASMNRDFYQDNHEIEVKQVSMDDFVKEQNISRVDLVKIDVESYEFDVLRGMENIVRKYKPIIICEIFNFSQNKESIGLFMGGLDYNIFSIRSEGLLKIENLKDFNKEENSDYLFADKFRDDFFSMTKF